MTIWARRSAYRFQ